MLMYRGEALGDFMGPDCRFVNFKKGDPVYVYYKLAGGSPEVWAGSVGHIFGYFPKDLIKVLHKYTKEELQVPTDETDFVCFEGGKDDFDNYNIEELLGSLELYDSAPEGSGKPEENVPQYAEKHHEVSKETELKPEPVKADSGESAFSESAEELQGEFSAQKSHPHASSRTDSVQGAESSLDTFEEMLHDKLKVPETENKTSNSSQVPNEQEKIDAHKLLKTDVSLGLKTKFGSTTDALVSDDESTRLVTSLEDDFDEELDAEYYAVEDGEEENTDNLDELPLLTFTDGEDKKAPEAYEVEKDSLDKALDLSEEGKVEPTLPPGVQSDGKDRVTTWGDTFFSVITGGEEKPGMSELESSNSEDKKEEENVLVLDNKERKPLSATDYANHEGAEDSKANDEKDSEMDPDLLLKGKEKEIQESKRGLVQNESELENGKPEMVSTYSSQSKINSLPAAKKGKESTLKEVFEKKNDLKEPVIHISKETHHEENTAEILENDLESDSVPRAVGSPVTEEKSEQESLGVAPPLADNQPNTSKDSMAGTDALAHEPKTDKQEKIREPDLKTQNQPRFPPPEEAGLSTELEEKAPTLGRNLPWQQERDAAAVLHRHEQMGLSKEEGKEDSANAELAHPKAIQGTQEAGNLEVPNVRTLDAEADEGDYPPEDLLEDENALSAQQSRENHPGVQEKRSDTNPQVSEKVILGSLNPDSEGNKQEASMILETEKKSETAQGVDGQDREPSRGMVGQEESPPVDARAQGPFEVGGFPEETVAQTPGSREVVQGNNPEELVSTSGLVEKPGGKENSEEEAEDAEMLRGPEGQGPTSQDLEGDLFHQTPPTIPDIVLKSIREDLPIISSFFEDQQALHRFLKYFDVHELEAMLQDMSVRLKSAQRDSLPYNVEKVLDKVFRSSESRILSVAERMLDTQVTKNRDLGIKESNVLEEAAVLDDIQDLIYFVRYQHPGVETAPLITPPPLEEDWAGPAEEVRPPQEDKFPQENTGDLTMPLPEEPVTRDMAASEVSQKPNTDNDIDPGLLVTEGSPVGAADDQKQQEMRGEEPANAPPVKDAMGLLHSFTLYLSKMLIATLPDGVQPGPDFYGLPWQPVVITAVLGAVSFAVFSWRTILVVKSRVYQVTEKQISEKLENIKKENAELAQKLSNYEQKIKESKKYVQETKKQNVILSDEAIKYKDKIKTLEETNEILGDKAKSLRLLLDSEREQNIKNQDLILENKQSIEKLKDVISMNASELSEVQIALNEAKLREENVKSECHRVQEENTRLKKKKEQLQQQIEEWSKSHAELNEQIKSFERAQKDLEVALTHKDDNINALTNCITQLNRLECELESEDQNKGQSDELANGEVGGERSEKIKSQIKQMMDVSRTQTAVSVVEEDLKLLQLKLRASMSTKCNLEDQIKKLEDDRDSLQTAKAGLEDECRTLRQKVEILNELYQQKEMALQKKLSQEEYERQDREQRLSAADEKVVLAAEEVKTYKRRIEEMEEELQKTERSFKNQIAAHEKKAHDNWLKARAAERAIAEEKREAANLRHKLLEMTQKMAMRQEEPVIIKPMPGRPNAQNPLRRGPLSQNGSFGPSPVSGGECSPPLPAEPPGRPLSATLSRRDVPRSEFGSLDRHLPRPRWSSEASGKHSASDPGPAPVMNSSSRSSSPAKVMDEGKVNMAPKGPPPPFPGVPLLGAPLGGPVPPPIRYGPPPQLRGPFPPRPLPPFVPGMRPPLGVREYAPGVLPGIRDLPVDPREFLPGHTPFRPPGSFGPREYFNPGTRLPPPPHLPPPAARDSLPSGPRDEPPPASLSSSQDGSQASKPSP